MVEILVERKGVTRCNSDFQYMWFCSVLPSITLTAGRCKDWSERDPVAIGWDVRMHPLKGLIDEKSYAVFFFA